MTHKEREIRRNEMRAYKAEGHTSKEVAERFGVSRSFAKKVCNGIAPQGNQYTSGKFDRVANAKRYIEERTPQFEYAGNFTGIDGFVDLKCKICGTITKRSFVSVKHGTATCGFCVEETRKQKAEKRAEQKDAQKREAKEKKKAERDARNKAKIRELMLTNSYSQIAMKQCPVCQSLFVGKRKYCSDECRIKNYWNIKGEYRYLFPLEELYERDNGICYLCGKPCDWNDKEEKNGVIVYGNNYPSRDHVIPKSKGGEHSWENLRLAHRLCNTRKSNIPLVKKITKIF